jgi:uncharacterized protein (TIGR00730 family)
MPFQRITVFGGSQPRQGDPAFEAAVTLGWLLGQQGYTILTGGYMGTMEAVSRGASEAGAHVIGVTCEEIERWRPIHPNAWVKEEIRCLTLKDRAATLIEQCDAALALPGGPGTLAEISLMWNLLIIGALPPKPLILIGPGWQETIETLYRSLSPYIPSSQRQILTFAPSVEAAVRQLE